MARPSLLLPILVGLLRAVGRSRAFSAAVGPSPRARLALRAASSPGGGNDRDDARPRLLGRRREFVVRSIVAGTAGIVSAAAIPPFVVVGPASADDETPPDPTPIDPSVDLPTVTKKVYLDVKFAKYKEPKRLVIGLFGDVMPRTVENFVALATSTSEGEPSYAGSTFYRVLSGMSIQGGAVGDASGKSGTSSSLEGGKPFPPDNYRIRHTKRGLVSAVRTSGGEIDSRFFVQTEDDAGWADDRYAAFGIVLEGEGGTTGEGGASGGGGMDLVRRISNAEVKTPQNSPKEPIAIVGCGILDG